MSISADEKESLTAFLAEKNDARDALVERQRGRHNRRLGREVLRDDRRPALGEAAVAALPPGDREALLVRHIERFGTAEIALALGMTEAGVKSRLYRAVTRLRIKLQAKDHL